LKVISTDLWQAMFGACRDYQRPYP